jgi:RNA polymerase sigma-70 factor (ECF subfamily)
LQQEDRKIFGQNTSRAEIEKRFDDLLAANGPALLRLARSYTKTISDRDDLFQDITLAIWKALPGFRQECSERTFVFRIANNRAMTFLAQRRPAAEPDNDIEMPDPGLSPEAELSRDQEGSRLAKAIQTLPIEYRQVITLTLEDLSYAEISGVLGIGESNVGVRLNRARQMLRRLLEESANARR